MGTQPEQGTYDATVYSYETTDPVKGGIGGTANAPLLNLSNRTGWLKAQVASILAEIAQLAGLNSPTFTGSPRAPTQAAGDNSTLIATDAFVQGAVNGSATIPLTTGGTVNLPGVLAAVPILRLTGTITGPIVLVFPAQPGRWSIIDDTSGGFPISLKTPTGANVCLTIHGQGIDVTSDGTNMRYVGSASALTVQGNLNLYVSTSGSDTSRTGLDPNYPLFTIAAALSYAAAYYRGSGGSLIINILSGTYGQSGCISTFGSVPPGFSQVVFNGAGAGATVLDGYTGITTANFSGDGVYALQNLSIAGNGGGHSAFASSGAVLGLTNVTFTGSGAGAHVVAGGGGTINVNSGIVVSGGGIALFYAGPDGAIHCDAQTITLTGTPAFSQATVLATGGVVELSNTVYSGGATGSRFQAVDNGVITTGTLSPFTALPGSNPGYCQNGGQIDAGFAPGCRRILSTGLILYVDQGSGNDLNVGVTPGSGAFLTMQAAFNHLMDFYDGGGNTATISAANGTYTLATLNNTVGFSSITVVGSGSNCIMGGGLVFNGGIATTVEDVVLQNSNGTCLGAFNGANVAVNNVIFAGAGSGAHVLCETGSTVDLANYTIAGNAASHINCTNGGVVQVNSTTITLSASATITTFIYSEGSSTVIFSNVTIAGSGSVTGQKYLVGLNSCLLTYGSNGTNVPGSTAGAATQGGQLT